MKKMVRGDLHRLHFTLFRKRFRENFHYLLAIHIQNSVYISPIKKNMRIKYSIYHGLIDKISEKFESVIKIQGHSSKKILCK